MNQDKTPLMVLEEFVKENQVQGFNFMIINSEILLEKIQSLKGMEEEVINEAYEKGDYYGLSNIDNYYQSKFGKNE